MVATWNLRASAEISPETAESIGAKTVKGPPDKAESRPAALIAAASFGHLSCGHVNY